MNSKNHSLAGQTSSDMMIEASTNKSYFYILAVLYLIAVTGIYVVPAIGLRTDHIIVYILGSIIFILFIRSKIALVYNASLVLIVSIFLMLIFLGVLGLVMTNHSFDVFAVLASLENYLQPLIIIIIAHSIFLFAGNKDISDVVRSMLQLTVAFFVLNTILSFIIFYVGPGEYLELIGGRKDEQGLTVIERALIGGRNAGVFNQPIEGGVAYSLALLFWIYLYKIRENNSAWYIAQFFIVIIGGILSGSKIFYLIGLPSAFVYLHLTKNYKLLYSLRFITIGFIAFTLFSVVVNAWPGKMPIKRGLVYFDRLTFFVTSSSEKNEIINKSEKNEIINKSEKNEIINKLADVYTSGRLSSGSSIYSTFEKIYSTSPIFGFGFGGMRVSDSAILEVFSIGGIIGIGAYVLIFVGIFYASWRARSHMKDASYLMLSTWIILSVASIGAPILTANRISIIVWLFTTIFILLMGAEKNKVLILGAARFAAKKTNV